MFLATTIHQHWDDLFLWEWFLNKHDVRTLIELGTGYGAMSTFLALQALQRGARFVTFDNIRQNHDRPVQKLLDLQGKCQLMDIFDDAGRAVISAEISTGPHPVCLFCDDGFKPRECQVFGPMLSRGDYLVVHDWDSEVNAGDLSAGYTKIEESAPTRNAYRTAWFIKD